MTKELSDLTGALLVAMRQLEDAERNLDMAAAYLDMHQIKVSVGAESFINDIDCLRYDLIKQLDLVRKLAFLVQDSNAN
tara:strand:- start:747 stop:983 length:237 start_codon:yes stop_codon:yes gene_type:complete